MSRRLHDSVRQFAAQERMELTKYLNHKIIMFRGKHYTPRKLIEFYANWAGGAHYSRNLPAELGGLLTLNIAGYQPVANALLQIGQATLDVGRDLLKRLVDFEFHAVVFIPKQEVSDRAYLFDSQYMGSQMRISLLIDNRLMPIFIVAGLQGTRFGIRSDRIIDWTAPRYIRAKHTIEEDLSSELELPIDGERISRKKIVEPLFVLSDLANYETFHNRSVDGDQQNFCFSVSEIVMVNSSLNPKDKSNMLLYFEKRRMDYESKTILYSPGSFARAPRGTTNLTMTGDVKHIKMADVLSNQDVNKAGSNSEVG